MKIKKVADGMWEIFYENEMIGEIQSFWRYNKPDGKILYVKGAEIGVVKNQKEALLKTKKYLNIS